MNYINIVIDSISVLFGILSLTLAYSEREVWDYYITTKEDYNFDYILRNIANSNLTKKDDIATLMMFIMGVLVIIGIFVNFVNILLELKNHQGSILAPICIYFVSCSLLSASLVIFYSSKNYNSGDFVSGEFEPDDYNIVLRSAIFFVYLLLIISFLKLFVTQPQQIQPQQIQPQQIQPQFYPQQIQPQQIQPQQIQPQQMYSRQIQPQQIQPQQMYSRQIQPQQMYSRQINP